MPENQCGWIADVSRGPDWLFVRLKDGRVAGNSASCSSLADVVARLLEKHFLHRVVIELDQLAGVDDELMRELHTLAKWIGARDGMLRLCGRPKESRIDVRSEFKRHHLPCYGDRREAVTARSAHDDRQPPANRRS